MSLRREKNCWQQDISKKEYTGGILQGIGITVLIAFVFYQTAAAVIPLCPVGIMYVRSWCRQRERKKMQEFQRQFKDMLQNLSTAMHVGYAVENAVKETLKDLKSLYPPDSRIIKELSYMVHQLNMNITVEQAMVEFSTRLGQEDLQNFTAVFTAANRMGGDLMAVLKRAGSQICDKIEVKREIQTLMSAKQLEFQVMSCVPFGILLYMKLAFPEFMKCLYGNVAGIIIMSICLVGYLFAYQFGRRIVEIEV